jgi:hypothetical protein
MPKDLNIWDFYRFMASATAVLVYEMAVPISFTIADASAIEKGDTVILSTPMTVAISTGANELFGGIAAEEKIANDGKTKIAVYRSGVFKVEVGSAGATVGKDAVLSAKNEYTDYTTLDGEKGESFGKFLESGTDGQFVMMELGK